MKHSRYFYSCEGDCKRETLQSKIATKPNGWAVIQDETPYDGYVITTRVNLCSDCYAAYLEKAKRFLDDLQLTGLDCGADTSRAETLRRNITVSVARHLINELRIAKYNPTPATGANFNSSQKGTQ